MFLSINIVLIQMQTTISYVKIQSNDVNVTFPLCVLYLELLC